MMDDQPDLVEARIQLSEARTDTKLANLIGELHVFNARLEAKFDALTRSVDALAKVQDEMRTVMRSWGQWTIGIILAVGIGTIGTLIGLLAFGQGEFGRGLNVRDVVDSAIAHHLASNQLPKP